MFDGTEAPSTVCDVPPAHLPLVWPRIEELVTRAINSDDETPTRYTVEDVRKLTALGGVKLWVAYVDHEFKAVMFTTIDQYPRCRECRIWFVAGDDLDSWKADWLKTIEDYSRANACLRISTCGREGWLRLYGGKRVGYEMVRPLWGKVA